MTFQKAFVAKITRPATSGIYARKRLFKLLDSGWDQPLTWISGPAGSGKTTLAASWLDSKQRHSLWYRLDESDSEIDDLSEEPYQLLMKCCLKLDRRAAAAAAYNRCRQTLAAAFGIALSEKTENIFRTISSRTAFPRANATYKS
jgi:ATP/maltotriose-dependent transcriptional regulator MalT